MAQVSVLTSRFTPTRVLVVRLTNALSQTVPLSEWAERQCQCVNVVEHGNIEPSSVKIMQFNYAMVMAVQGDGHQAEQWLQALLRHEEIRTVLALVGACNDGGEFGSGWDVTLVDRGGRFDALLPLLLGPRYVGHDDADLFTLLGLGQAIVYRPNPTIALEDLFPRAPSAVIARFVMSTGPATASREVFSLVQAEQLGSRWRASLNPDCDWLLSIGEQCHAGNEVQVIAVYPTETGRSGADS